MEENGTKNTENATESTPESASGTLGPLEQAQKDLEAARNELLYARAEFENYKRRILKETDASIKLANRSLVTEVAGIVDFFERAIEHSKTLKEKGDTEVKNFVSGVEMTHQELVNLLGRFGVEFVGKAGEKFNPETHEAISQTETDDDKIGTVLAVHQRGCTLNGKLIKPARVVVGSAKAS